MDGTTSKKNDRRVETAIAHTLSGVIVYVLAVEHPIYVMNELVVSLLICLMFSLKFGRKIIYGWTRWMLYALIGVIISYLVAFNVSKTENAYTHKRKTHMCEDKLEWELINNQNIITSRLIGGC